MCASVFPGGTRSDKPMGGRAMRGGVQRARAILKQSGYNGERTVPLNPTDLVAAGPLGGVTNDPRAKIGMNAEMVGTLVRRRVSPEPVEKGGWSLPHTWGPPGGSAATRMRP